MLDCGKLVIFRDVFPFEMAIIRPVKVQMTDQAALLIRQEYLEIKNTIDLLQK